MVGIIRWRRKGPGWADSILEKKETPSYILSKTLEYVAGSNGDNIPMTEQDLQTDEYKIPYQDFPLPERM